MLIETNKSQLNISIPIGNEITTFVTDMRKTKSLNLFIDDLWIKAYDWINLFCIRNRLFILYCHTRKCLQCLNKRTRDDQFPKCINIVIYCISLK